MKQRTLIGAAAFSAALAGGGVAGAVLGTPGVSGAQDDTAPTATATVEEDTGTKPFRPGPRGERLETAAEALGMTPAELREELRAGKSIAQVAEEQGVDKQVVIDAPVAEGTERLEEAIAALPERVSEAVEREGLPDRRGPRGHRPGERGPRPAEDAPTDAPS